MRNPIPRAPAGEGSHYRLVAHVDEDLGPAQGNGMVCAELKEEVAYLVHLFLIDMPG